VNWSPIDVLVVSLAIIGSLTSMIVTIIAALKGNAAQAQALVAQAQSHATQQALVGLSDRVLGHDQQLNQLALQLPSSIPASAQTSCDSSDTQIQKGAK
jgi:type II secretory pathway pseudopilin PulG